MSQKKSPKSEKWWPDIRALACSFVDYLNSENASERPKVVFDQEEFEFVLQAYSQNLDAFKKAAFNKDADKHNIDRHKITALYIKSILQVSPFKAQVLNDAECSLRASLPNEHFALVLVNAILLGWSGKNQILTMGRNEKKWFIILMNHYRLHPDSLDILSLSQIIYYIERSHLPS